MCGFSEARGKVQLRTKKYKNENDELSRQLFILVSQLTIPEKLKAKDLITQLHMECLANAAAFVKKGSHGHIRRFFKKKPKRMSEAAQRLVDIRNVIQGGPEAAYKSAIKELRLASVDEKDGGKKGDKEDGEADGDDENAEDGDNEGGAVKRRKSRRKEKKSSSRISRPSRRSFISKMSSMFKTRSSMFSRQFTLEREEGESSEDDWQKQADVWIAAYGVGT